MIVENLAFLIIRLVTVFKYKKDESVMTVAISSKPVGDKKALAGVCPFSVECLRYHFLRTSDFSQEGVLFLFGTHQYQFKKCYMNTLFVVVQYLLVSDLEISPLFVNDNAAVFEIKPPRHILYHYIC